MQSKSRTVFKTYQFALVICRNFDGRWLAVNETRGRGWWIPGGAVDSGESFYEAAQREMQEEAGIEIEIKGVLRVEHNIDMENRCRMRVIFYAEPIDQDQKPKSVADSESLEARWMTLEEFKNLDNIRGDELLEWGQYIENGGQIFPVGIFTRETSKMPKPEDNKSFSFSKLDKEDEKIDAPTKLKKVIKSKDIEGLTKFLQASFDINTPLNERKLTALHYAIKVKAPLELIKLLINAGSDICMITRSKRNVFHYAAQRYDIEILELLIKSYQDKKESAQLLQQKDSRGLTPLDMIPETEKYGGMYNLLDSFSKSLHL